MVTIVSTAMGGGEHARRPVEVCLSWYSQDEYAKLQGIAPGQLLPYTEWRASFEKARSSMLQRYGSVLVTTVTADALCVFAKAAGLPLGPVASASFAVAACSGAILAPVERVTRH